MSVLHAEGPEFAPQVEPRTILPVCQAPTPTPTPPHSSMSARCQAPGAPGPGRHLKQAYGKRHLTFRDAILKGKWQQLYVGVEVEGRN